jgi:hypothetical protein
MNARVPTLYQVADEFLVALHDLTSRDELPAEVIRDTLEGLQYPVEQKAINVAGFFQSLEAECQAMKAAETRIAERRKRTEAHVDRLKAYLREQMERCGITEIKSPEFRLSLRKNPPRVEHDGHSPMPPFYLRIPEPPAPVVDKRAILDDLKAGKEVPGWKLTQDNRLHID